MIPKFVAALRQRVGPSHPLWLAGVNGLIFDPEGRSLLQRSRETEQWGLLSGIIEPGEHPVAALRREVQEEAGLEISNVRFVGFMVTPQRRHKNGDVAQYLEILFKCLAEGLPIIGDDESLELCWFSRADLPVLSARDMAKIHLAYGQAHD